MDAAKQTVSFNKTNFKLGKSGKNLKLVISIAMMNTDKMLYYIYTIKKSPEKWQFKLWR